MLPFRIIYIDANASRTTFVVSLEGAPMVGDPLELPHGETVIVQHVSFTQRDDIAGIIVAGPAG